MNFKTPLISVIVPIYQIDRYIGTCIESIINQTYSNLEIILVDDGSTDRCPEICDLYARKDSRIVVIHKENGGLVSARKAGLLAATGDYVGYVDGDDWIGPGFYEALCTIMETSGADLVAAGHSRDLFHKSEHFVNSIPLGLYEGEKLEYLLSHMLSNGDFYRPGITTYVWNKLFKRRLLMDSQMRVDERISVGEDAAVTYPALAVCRRVYVTDNCAYHYRQREDSMLKKSAPFHEEVRKLDYLYQYLSAFAKGQPERYGLQGQVDDFVLSIGIMRSGGVLGNGNRSAFEQDFTGKRVVIYSAGTFGQQLVNRFKENGRCHITGWIDDDYWEYRRCCLDVDPVEEVIKRTFDYVLIATVDCAVAEKIKNRLLDFGVSPQKLLTVQCPRELRGHFIEAMLNNQPLG